jgi:hypothetical protein
MDAEKHTFSFQVDAVIAEKVNELVGFCRNNEVRCSEGLVMRALIERTELGPDLLGLVRVRKEVEKAARLKRFEEGGDVPRKRRRAQGSR